MSNTVRKGTVKIEIHHDKDENSIVDIRQTDTIYITKCASHPTICYIHVYGAGYWVTSSFGGAVEDFKINEFKENELRSVPEELMLRIVAAAAHPERVL